MVRSASLKNLDTGLETKLSTGKRSESPGRAIFGSSNHTTGKIPTSRKALKKKQNSMSNLMAHASGNAAESGGAGRRTGGRRSVPNSREATRQSLATPNRFIPKPAVTRGLMDVLPANLKTVLAMPFQKHVPVKVTSLAQNEWAALDDSHATNQTPPERPTLERTRSGGSRRSLGSQQKPLSRRNLMQQQSQPHAGIANLAEDIASADKSDAIDALEAHALRKSRRQAGRRKSRRDSATQKEPRKMTRSASFSGSTALQLSATNDDDPDNRRATRRAASATRISAGRQASKQRVADRAAAEDETEPVKRKSTKGRMKRSSSDDVGLLAPGAAKVKAERPTFRRSSSSGGALSSQPLIMTPEDVEAKKTRQAKRRSSRKEPMKKAKSQRALIKKVPSLDDPPKEKAVDKPMASVSSNGELLTRRKKRPSMKKANSTSALIKKPASSKSRRASRMKKELTDSSDSSKGIEDNSIPEDAIPEEAETSTKKEGIMGETELLQLISQFCKQELAARPVEPTEATNEQIAVPEVTGAELEKMSLDLFMKDILNPNKDDTQNSNKDGEAVSVFVDDESTVFSEVSKARTPVSLRSKFTKSHQPSVMDDDATAMTDDDLCLDDMLENLLSKRDSCLKTTSPDEDSTIASVATSKAEPQNQHVLLAPEVEGADDEEMCLDDVLENLASKRESCLAAPKMLDEDSTIASMAGGESNAYLLESNSNLHASLLNGTDMNLADEDEEEDQTAMFKTAITAVAALKQAGRNGVVLNAVETAIIKY